MKPTTVRTIYRTVSAGGCTKTKSVLFGREVFLFDKSPHLELVWGFLYTFYVTVDRSGKDDISYNVLQFNYQERDRVIL